MTCMICRDQEAQHREAAHDVYRVNCTRCGTFTMTWEAGQDWPRGHWERMDARQQANASGWVRQHPQVQIDSAMLDYLGSIPSPSVSERADKLLAEAERREPAVGGNVQIHNTAAHVKDFQGIAWASTPEEVHYLTQHVLLGSRKHLVGGRGEGNYTITPEGYDYLEKMRQTNAGSHWGFVAMWFDQEVDAFARDGIEAGIRAARYEPKRIDRVEHNNRIDDEIMATIKRSRFVVADYTGDRGGVYFEAGYGMGLGLPVIWTVREDWLERLHFDVRQYAFIQWRADALPDFAERLKNRIEATIGRGSFVARQ